MELVGFLAASTAVRTVGDLVRRAADLQNNGVAPRDSSVGPTARQERTPANASEADPVDEAIGSPRFTGGRLTASTGATGGLPPASGRQSV
jgi:hypothetical protein